MESSKNYLESLISDCRYALRMLYRSPGFTVVAVLSLGLVIAANTTVFSVLNSMLFRTLPHHEPERLVRLEEIDLRRPDFPVNPTFPTVANWNESARSLEGIGMIASFPTTISARDQSESGVVEWVSPNLFSILGVAPKLGRHFTLEDALFDKGDTAILSDSFWRRRFAADPGVLGERLIVAGKAVTVVGVMPSGFWIQPWTENRVDVWQACNIEKNLYAPSTRWFDAIGRLKEGVTLEQSRLELTALKEHLQKSGSAENGEWQVRVESLQDSLFRGWESTFYLLFAVSLFILLIGCVNVANMLLARTGRREKEIAIRVAVGADRWRLIRQLLAESVLLSLLGGVAGVLLTFWGIRLFVLLIPPYWSLGAGQIDIDGRVLLFTLVVSLATGLILGLAPAIRSSRPNLVGSLKKGFRQSSGGSHPRLRAALIVAEISLALALLVGAGLMVHSFIRLRLVDPGFDPKNLLEAQIFIWAPEYWERIEDDKKRVKPAADRFFEDLAERVEALPNVEAVALRGSTGCNFRIQGSSMDPSKEERSGFSTISAGYFRTLGISVLKGREFSEQDREGSSWVAVVNETLAKQFFPDGDPIGKALLVTFGGERLGITVDEGRPREIVGVVSDEKSGLGWRPYPRIYVPHRQHISDLPGATYFSVVNKALLVRTVSNPISFVPSIERAISEVDPNQAARRIETVEQRLSDSIQYWRFWMRLFLFSGALAVLLVVIGIFGVLSYAVSERTHEIGIRMAIGAQRSRVLAMIMKSGLKLTLIGLVIGIAMSLGLSRLISSFLFGVTPNDPLTYAAVVLLLIGVVMAASYIPARRATEVDPLVALRSE